MDFGRVDDLGALPPGAFCLPPDASATASVLGTFALGGARPRLHVGAPVWAHPKLARRLTPPSVKGLDVLRQYARGFDTLELNSTFYTDPADELSRLRPAVDPDFTFAPKLPRSITHDARLVDVDREVERFALGLEALGCSRGPCWLLTPPGFGPDEGDRLERFVESHAPLLSPLAIELREPAWFERSGPLERLCDVFERHGVGLVITDVLGRRDVCHMRLTAPWAFVRFTGNALHPTDYTRLDAWFERLEAWFEAGLREVWFFLHQPDEGLVVELAQRLACLAEERLGIELRRPAPREIEQQHELFG